MLLKNFQFFALSTDFQSVSSAKLCQLVYGVSLGLAFDAVYMIRKTE